MPCVWEDRPCVVCVGRQAVWGGHSSRPRGASLRCLPPRTRAGSRPCSGRGHALVEMRLRELVPLLERCKTWKKPKVELEQYPTPPDIAAHMLLAAHSEGDVEDCLVADLGCGGGVLGIGAAHLGAEHVVCVDLDPSALEVAAQNIADAEDQSDFSINVDLLHSNVMELAARGRRNAAARRDAQPSSSQGRRGSDGPSGGGTASHNTPTDGTMTQSLPHCFIESALPTRRAFDESLSLPDAERARVEEEARTKYSGPANDGLAQTAGATTATTPPDVAKLSLKEHDDGGGRDEDELAPLGQGHFDCVLTNPPFGTQKHSNGADMAFLRAALALCTPTGAVYSLHKSSTRSFIAKRAAEWGVASAKVVAEVKFEIPKMYKHHKKASLDVAVDFWQMRVEARDPDEQ